jgi:microcystin-dependent protein
MEGYIGEIRLVGYEFVPIGWMACKGQLLPIQHHEALYSLLYTKFGGDGRTVFGLPNLTPPNENTHYVICVDGIYPQRS